MKISAAAISFLLSAPLILFRRLLLIKLNWNTGMATRAPAMDVTALINPSYFSNSEKIPLANCPKPMYRWVLTSHHLDCAVYSGNHFCGCITHEGATTRNGFVACH
ncbi:hypothetical protein BDN70DRAFT_896999 [Pholiota conissans]|uniref:Uncharacterized protein n=1 Tax=Pholiota conissans TaxID=109636 RepID=A0A9P5YZG5_9AGAR|nr:hypothetical protein BDN70DRAFT_896999 [Pholiota conissans]